MDLRYFLGEVCSKAKKSRDFLFGNLSVIGFIAGLAKLSYYFYLRKNAMNFTPLSVLSML